MNEYSKNPSTISEGIVHKTMNLPRNQHDPSYLSTESLFELYSHVESPHITNSLEYTTFDSNHSENSPRSFREMTSEQLDDILRFEERLRYNYIIMKRIQFKYVFLLSLLILWAIYSLFQVFIIDSRSYINSLYISCALIVLFIIMNFHRDKIARPSK
jgi:hypothetical protein